ncbi:hypothetical protein ABZW18_31610 [Streptomyces sp. NPDC004647]|uniref:hypothetical protein n=1 Tax=Streptomyces sp. NPDC004647 TaxID=3154671 RepID=UPI0033BF35EB
MPPIVKFGPNDSTWRKVAEGVSKGEIYVGDVFDDLIDELIPGIDRSNVAMGYCHYGPESSNSLTISMVEYLAIAWGELTIQTDDGQEATAGPGEGIRLLPGTNVTYSTSVDTLMWFFTSPGYRHTPYSLQVESEYFEPGSPGPIDLGRLGTRQ